MHAAYRDGSWLLFSKPNVEKPRCLYKDCDGESDTEEGRDVRESRKLESDSAVFSSSRISVVPWPVLRVDILTSIRNKMKPSISNIMALRKNTAIAVDILKQANLLKNSETVNRQITRQCHPIETPVPRPIAKSHARL